MQGEQILERSYKTREGKKHLKTGCNLNALANPHKHNGHQKLLPMLLECMSKISA